MGCVWMVRAGEGGALFDLAYRDSMAVIGWPKMGDYSGLRTASAIRQALTASYPERTAGQHGSDFGQLEIFLLKMTANDLVLIPAADKSTIGIGEVTGPPEFRPNSPELATCGRPLRWLGSIERSALPPDLESQTHSLKTVSQIKALDAESRLREILAGGPDPGGARGDSNGAVHWFVSVPRGLDATSMPDYLAKQQWDAPEHAVSSAMVGQMKKGDLIALKSVSNRKGGLPFFNADRLVSTMTVWATGQITNAAADGTISVEWDPHSSPRDWYFYTSRRSIWKVVAEQGPYQQAVVDFAFGKSDQQLDAFLMDNYWRARYPPRPEFTWVGFCEEMATSLLKFRNDRSALVETLIEMAETEPLLDYLVNDRFPDGTAGPITDIDPFSVMGAFNRGLTDDNRLRIAKTFADRLGLHSPAPTDFEGVPILNNQNSWFIGFSANRGVDDVDVLWQCFEAGLALADADNDTNRQQFIHAYDQALRISGIKWNLSQGLFRARPNSYVTLDGPSRDYLREHFGVTAPPQNGAPYIALRDRLRLALVEPETSITSFPLLSFVAWLEGLTSPQAHDIRAFAGWAALLADEIDLDEEENRYKLKTAALLSEARAQADQAEPDWVATFRKALSSTNTIDFRFSDTVVKAVQADPDGFLELFQIVWNNPVPASLDSFQEQFRARLGRVTPGNATALGAMLLMADNTEDHAPYSPSRTSRWYRLTNFPGSNDDASATSRYTTMLSFLDALANELDEQFGGKPTRLETQGAAWMVTEHAIPESWNQSQRAALSAWRGDELGSSRGWLIRAKNRQFDQWLAGGYVALDAAYLGTVEAGADLKAVKGSVETGYQHEGDSQRKALSAEFHAFLSTMKFEDIVAAQTGSALHLGRVTGQPEYVETGHDRLRRSVSWLAEVPKEALTETLEGLLDTEGNLVDITTGYAILTDLLENYEAPELPASNRPGPLADVIPRLPSVTADLTRQLHIEDHHLQEIIDLLQHRQQIVLYGPPGTGKTYLAMKLGRHLVGPEDRSRVQLVQFHPSYAYEDFFEGYRPTETESGQPGFALTDGPLRRIAKAAAEHPDQPFVLVIDELNRANLAKVFGELYFLLEYRKESIRLQYRPADAFQLPRNLFFIGTMNTADRSIALLDGAMRRRFSFVEMHPDVPPVCDLLTRWLEANEQDGERAKLLAALNSAIEEQDRDLRIGPSYLMRDEAGTEAGLERVWKYDLMPLLEEHYYGRFSRDEVQGRFSLQALRARLQGVPTNEEQSDMAEPDELFEEEAARGSR